MAFKPQRGGEDGNLLQKPDNTHKPRAGAAVRLAGQREPERRLQSEQQPGGRVRAARRENRNEPPVKQVEKHAGNVADSPQKERKCCSCEII